jgi:uncharacterized protein (TIGR00251 family)
MPPIRLNIKVIPNSKHNKIDSITEGEGEEINLKLRVTAQPVDGKANAAVIELLSDYYNIAKSNIEVVGGWTSRQKKVIIHNLQREEVLKNAQMKFL